MSALGPKPKEGDAGYDCARDRYEDVLEELADKAIHIDDDKMYDRVDGFDVPEFLQFVVQWFKHQGIRVDGLVAAPIEEFAGRCAMADFVLAMQRVNPQSDGDSDDIKREENNGKKTG